MTDIRTGIPRSGVQDVDALLSTYAWAPNNSGDYIVTYSFPDSSSYYNYFQQEIVNYGYGTFVPMTTTQQAAVIAILGMYSEVADISFSQVTEAVGTEATMRFAQSTGDYTAFAYYPDTDSTGGDSWYSTFNGDYSNPEMGNYAWTTFIHEIGHALGLKHGHENDVGAYGRMTSAHNSLEYSVMTYASYIGDNPNDPTGYTEEDDGFPQTLMMYDIAALQYMYGPNFTTNGGDSTYSWSPSTGEMFINGVGQGAPSANRIFMTLWDGGGQDAYNLSNYTTAVTIDLNPGAWTTTATSQLADLNEFQPGYLAEGNIANALLYQGNTASMIENAMGGLGNDTVIGNSLANRLYGYGGNDTFTGGAGNDFIDGGSGSNTAVYSGVHTNYDVSYSLVMDMRIGSPDGTDTISNITFLTFSDGTFSIDDFFATLIYYYAVNSSGDYYYGYFYDSDDYAYGYIGSTDSESGLWSYYIYAMYEGYEPALNGYNYITDYFDYESGTWSEPYYYGIGGYSGWDPANPISSGVEYAIINGGYSYFDSYYEADGSNLVYYWALNSSGDYYYGYFYGDGAYSYGYQTPTVSESGFWDYYIYAIYEGYGSPAQTGYNYITDYYDAESATWSVPYAYSTGGYAGWDPGSPIDSAIDWAVINGGYSYFDSYYEADGSNLFYYWALNSSGDYYYGYFYDDDSYSYGYQTPTVSETGFWDYYIYAIYYGYGSPAQTGYNYVTDYYDYETASWSVPYNYETYGYSGWDPGSPITSAVDYALIDGFYAYFDSYWEAN